MPDLVDREVALNALSPYLRPIRASMLTAWQRWENLPPETRVDLGSGSRATIVHDLTVAEAAKQVSGVSIHNFDKLKVFLIGPCALRFKKLDERKRSCNQRTNQVDNFRNQRELPGIQSICNVEAGYVLDRLGMNVSGFHLVCPNGSGKPYRCFKQRGQESGY